MNERHIVRLFLLPSHQQSAVAIRPTVRALYDPPLRLVPALASLLPRLPIALRDVRRKSAPLERSSDRRVIVTLVGGQMLLARRLERGPLNRNALKRRAHHLRVVTIRSSDRYPDGRSSLVGQDMALGAHLAAIHGAFARRFAAQRSFRRRAVDGLPTPTDAAQLIVLSQEQAPDTFEDSAHDPLLEAPMQRRAGAELCGRSLALATCSQDEEDAVQTGAMCNAGSADRANSFLSSEQRANLVPQIVWDVPYRLKSGLACHDFASPKQSLKHSTTAL